MNTKLTLSVDPQVVKKAKAVAKRERTSVSKMVEGYLANLPLPASDLRLKGSVAKLAGVIKQDENDYREYKAKKHS